MFVLNELETIRVEYETYFPHIRLVSSADPYLLIVTKEGTLLTISVSESGWYLPEKSCFYQTFEALMDTKSPAFRASFANDLASKLSLLAQSSNVSSSSTEGESE